MHTGSHNSASTPSLRPTRIDGLASRPARGFTRTRADLPARGFTRTSADLLAALLCASACTSAPADTSDASTTDTTTASTTDNPVDTTTTPTTGEPAAPGPCEAPLAAPPRASARLTVDAAGILRDEHNRDVQLRGVNTGGRSKWTPFIPFPVGPAPTAADVAAAAPAYFARLREWGLDTVRVPFSWEALEPSEGQYDGDYLDRYVAMIDAAWALELRVIVDFHQDVYASPFCGDGFPLWTLLPDELGPPLRDCPDWGIGYIVKNGVRDSFDRFWADTNGIQSKYRGMWQQMAGRVADHPGVVGLELINEPGWGSAANIDAWKASTLNPFHTATIAWLRGLVGPGPLILYNNTGIEASGLSPVKHLRPDGDGIIYAPHLYDAGLVAGDPYAGNIPEDHIAPLAAFSRTSGVHPLIGEFGVQLDAAGGDDWLTLVVDSLDKHRVSGTLWEYSQNEELWNGEDLSLVDASGVERPIVDAYVRPWLRAVAGHAATFTYDHTTRRAAATWTSDGGITELALPPRLFPTAPPELTLTGPGACYTVDLDRGTMLVQAPEGTDVALTFTAP